MAIVDCIVDVDICGVGIVARLFSQSPSLFHAITIFYSNF